MFCGLDMHLLQEDPRADMGVADFKIPPSSGGMGCYHRFVRLARVQSVKNVHLLHLIYDPNALTHTPNV